MQIRVVTTETELQACFAIRLEVFVREQGVPEPEEIDALEPSCTHLLAELEGRPAGTARLLEAAECARAQRVAVRREHRGRGVGRALMEALHGLARQRGHREIVLAAQDQAIPFYERLGYRVSGPGFLDAGIPHHPMSRAL